MKRGAMIVRFFWYYVSGYHIKCKCNATLPKLSKSTRLRRLLCICCAAVTVVVTILTFLWSSFSDCLYQFQLLYLHG